MKQKLKKLFVECVMVAGVILVVILLVLISGCCHRKVIAQQNNTFDSTHIEVVERVEVKKDTVYVEIPSEKESVTVQHRYSHLENSVAKSDAIINEDGSLTHTLETIPQLRPVVIEKPLLCRDSIVYRNFFREVEKTVEVPAQLSWWQQTQIKGFWLLLAASALLLLWRKFKNKIRIV